MSSLHAVQLVARYLTAGHCLPLPLHSMQQLEASKHWLCVQLVAPPVAQAHTSIPPRLSLYHGHGRAGLPPIMANMVFVASTEVWLRLMVCW